MTARHHRLTEDGPAANASLDTLKYRIGRIAVPPGRSRSVLPFGVEEIDGALPLHGLPRAGLHEIQSASAIRFGFVAALLARQPSRDPILWCRTGEAAGALPHAPGLAGFGLAPERLLVIRTRREAEALWAMEEALRCGRLAAVLGEGMVPTPIAGRRLQLAAETGETPAFLLLPPTARPPPSVAVTRWRIAPVPGRREANRSGKQRETAGRPRWRIELSRCRGGGRGEWVVEWDDEALRLDLVAALADRPLAAAE